MFEEGKRDKNHSEDGYPVATVQSPGRGVGSRSRQVVIERLDDIRHQSFDNDQVTRLRLNISVNHVQHENT